MSIEMQAVINIILGLICISAFLSGLGMTIWGFIVRLISGKDFGCVGIAVGLFGLLIMALGGFGAVRFWSEVFRLMSA